MRELLFRLEVYRMEFDNSVRASLDMDDSGCTSRVELRKDEDTHDATIRVLAQLSKFVSRSPVVFDRATKVFRAFLDPEKDRSDNP